MRHPVEKNKNTSSPQEHAHVREKLDIPVCLLSLDWRIRITLRNAHVRYIGELVQMQPDIKGNFGRTTRESLESLLSTLDTPELQMGMSIPWWTPPEQPNLLMFTKITEETPELRQQLNAPVNTLPLSTRLRKALAHENIFYIGELVQRSCQHISRMNHVSHGTCKELELLLAKHQLTLSMGIPWWTPPKEKTTPR